MHCLLSALKIVLPLLSWILSIKIGLTFFPPFTNVLYAFVSLSNVVSAAPNETDKTSGILLYIPKLLVIFEIS